MCTGLICLAQQLRPMVASKFAIKKEAECISVDSHGGTYPCYILQGAFCRSVSRFS